MELFNPQSEKIVLSILVKDPDKIYESGALKTEHFSSAQTRMVFSTILELLGEGLVPDTALIYDRIIRNGQESLIDKGFLDSLDRIDYKEENYRAYEQNVVDSFIAKSLTKVAGQIETGLEKSKDVYSVANELSATISNLLSAGYSNTTKSSEELAPSYLAKFIQRVENPNKRFLTSGFPSIDSILGGVEPGNLWVIGGRTSMGKTALMVNSLIKCAEQGLPVLIFSKEMSWESLWDRMISIKSGIPLYKVRGGIVKKDGEEYGKVIKTIEEVRQFPINIDQNFVGTLDYMLSTIRKYKHKSDIQVVYIDYLQLIAERNSESVHELGRITKGLKLIAEELGIAIHLASQLNREVEYRDNKKPVLSDLRQSGNIEEDADVVAFLYRDEYYNPKSDTRGKIEFLIRKNRHGPIGTVTLDFDENTTGIK